MVRILKSAIPIVAVVLLLASDVFLSHPIEARGEIGRESLPPEELLVGYITVSYTPEAGTAKEAVVASGGKDRWPDMVRSVEYEGVEALADIPSEIGVQIWDRGREMAGYGRLELAGTEPLRSADGTVRSYWKDDFSMIVTFRAYGAETYELNGKRIAHQEGDPPLVGSEKELLGLIGADGKDYQITDAEWIGESYQDDYGILYRDARVAGLRKVTDYQAVYQGIAIFPEVREEHMILHAKADTEPLPAPAEAVMQETESITDSENVPVQEQIPSEPETPEDVSAPEPRQATLAETGSGQNFQGAGIWQQAKEGFERFSRQLEQWVYDRFSIYIPFSLLMGGSLIVLAAAVGAVYFLCSRRRKNSL